MSFAELRAPVNPEPLRQPDGNGKKAMGALAGIGVLIAKFFGYIKLLLLPLLKLAPFLKTGLSMLVTIGIYGSLYGWKWAVGFVLLIFVHESGHLIVARSFGLKVGAPVFIPFMGAFIALKEAPRNAWIESCVGIGGPVAGAIGSFACHMAGIAFDMPLLVAIGMSGYWLNLFNLIPLGQLDGGRIVTALSPWFWLPGLAIMGWLAVERPNFIIILVILASIPRLISLFKPKTDAQKRYFEIAPAQRWTMGVMYIGLIAGLAIGMFSAQEQLDNWARKPRAPKGAPVVATLARF